MCLGMFMAVLDIQVVASSLTAIQAALHIPLSQLGWIQTAYLMAEVVAIPLTGILTRALSLRCAVRRRHLGFCRGQLGCALSTSFDMLIAARVVQGFFGGMLIPSVFTAVFVLIPKRHHILATTLAGVAALMAPTMGPLAGRLADGNPVLALDLPDQHPAGAAGGLDRLATLKSERCRVERAAPARSSHPAAVRGISCRRCNGCCMKRPGIIGAACFVFGLAASASGRCALGHLSGAVGGASLCRISGAFAIAASRWAAG